MLISQPSLFLVIITLLQCITTRILIVELVYVTDQQILIEQNMRWNDVLVKQQVKEFINSRHYFTDQGLFQDLQDIPTLNVTIGLPWIDRFVPISNTVQAYLVKRVVRKHTSIISSQVNLTSVHPDYILIPQTHSTEHPQKTCYYTHLSKEHLFQTLKNCLKGQLQIKQHEASTIDNTDDWKVQMVVVFAILLCLFMIKRWLLLRPLRRTSSI